MTSIFITTTIPYVNARPHLGFALELVQADCLARYHRKNGSQVCLQTGTDENAFKNVEAARQNKIEPQEWVDQFSGQFRALAVSLQINFDDFVRTTEERHRETVHEILALLNPADLERRTYQGLYCKGCEDFWLERDLVDFKCPEHGTEVSRIEEENIFFLLSRYQERIEQLIESNTLLIRPPERRNEVLGFIRRGLQDISISRNAERAGGWGIPFPGAPDQVVYVWIDALINYLVSRGTPNPQWATETKKLHVLGKNVWKFHAIYWPALLLSCGLPLPDELHVHGFVTIDGRKISKSSGTTIDPQECIQKYGSDSLRFYLLHEIPAFADGDFSIARLESTYQEFLANGLGNLTSRLLTLAELSGLESIDCQPRALEVLTAKALQEGRFEFYLDHFWSQISALNQEIDHARPWEWLKTGDAAQAREKCADWLGRLHHIASWLEPALPDTSLRLLKLLSACPLRKTHPLFPRLHVHAIQLPG